MTTADTGSTPPTPPAIASLPNIVLRTPPLAAWLHGDRLIDLTESLPRTPLADFAKIIAWLYGCLQRSAGHGAVLNASETWKIAPPELTEAPFILAWEIIAWRQERLAVVRSYTIDLARIPDTDLAAFLSVLNAPPQEGMRSFRWQADQMLALVIRSLGHDPLSEVIARYRVLELLELTGAPAVQRYAMQDAAAVAAYVGHRFDELARLCPNAAKLS